MEIAQQQIKVTVLQKQALLLSVNFNLKIDVKQLGRLEDILHRAGVTDGHIREAATHLLKEFTAQEYQKRFGYNGFPGLADWMELSGLRKPKLSLDEMACIEANKMIEAARKLFMGYNDILCGCKELIFDNITTNSAARSYTLRDLVMALKKDKIGWIRKSVKEHWISCYHEGNAEAGSILIDASWKECYEHLCDDGSYETRRNPSPQFIKIGNEKICDEYLQIARGSLSAPDKPNKEVAYVTSIKNNF